MDLTVWNVSVELPFVATNQTIDVWSAISDGTRRAIVECLADSPLPVGELARRLPVSRPAVSQHLKVLKSVGLVRDRAIGTRRIYQLEPSGIQALRADLDRYWARALDAYKELVDELEGEQR